LSACLQCGAAFEASSRPKTYCSLPCQSKAANMRRATTRAGRREPYPRAGGSPTRPIPSTLTDIPPSVDMAATDLASLMAKANSRVGITAWEIATIAKLRGISPWSPLRVILAP
jgi:hypothetical protein